MPSEPQNPAEGESPTPSKAEAGAGAAVAAEGQSANPPNPGAGSAAGSAVAAGGVLAAILAKSKSLLVLLKALPFGKLLLTSGTLVASVLAYATRGGLAFAVGFVLLILVHELGHGAAIRAAGLPAGWPVFIPFFGAYISMGKVPADPEVEARIAYAGPLAGTAGGLICAAIGLFARAPFFLALAYTAFFLNLFNLVPFGFLDGGRIARVISGRAWVAGAVLLGLMFWASPSPQLGLIAVLGISHVFRADRAIAQQVTERARREWAARYFGLCAFLAAATYFAHALVERHGW